MSADMRHFLLLPHLVVSSNAVRVGYAVVRFNRVRIELTFYHYSLKRTHNLGLEGGPNLRWQYIPPFNRRDTLRRSHREMNCARMTRQEQYEQRLADYNQRKLRHYKNKRRLIAKLEKSGID